MDNVDDLVTKLPCTVTVRDFSCARPNHVVWKASNFVDANKVFPACGGYIVTACSGYYGCKALELLHSV